MKFLTNFTKEHRTLALTVLVAVLLIASGIYLATTRIQAVTPDWDWANQIGDVNEDHGKTVARDDAGNIYVTGEFIDTNNFASLGCVSVPTPPPNAGKSTIYIAKFDSTGDCIWALPVNGSSTNGDAFVNDIAVNSTGPNGEIYITGSFVGELTFPNAGPTLLDADSSGSAFIARLNFSDFIPTFTWEWADSLDSGGSSSNAGNALALYPTSSPTDVYFTGKFNGTGFLLDQSGGIITGPFVSTGDQDMFVTRLDSGTGGLSWFKTAGGSFGDQGLGIEVDSGVYVTGFFGLHATFGLGEALERHVISNYHSLPVVPFQTTTTSFVAKFDDSTGDLEWVKQMGGGVGLAVNYASDVQADSAGDVYATGMFTDGSTAAFHDLYNVTEIGGLGAAEGQFSGAYGISRDSSGNFYVSDTGNFRIQKFDSSFSFVEMWGWGVDDGSSVFQICTSGCQAGLSGTGAGQFDGPSNIAIDSSDNVYVVDTLNDRVQKFTQAGAFLLMFGKDVDTVDDGGGDNLNICTAAESATCQDAFITVPLDDAYEFNAAFGVATDLSDNVYIADTDNNRIQKFDLSGEFIEMWGKDVDTGPDISGGPNICTQAEDALGQCRAGTASAVAGEFDAPKGLTIYDSDVFSSEIVLIADSGNDRIQVFDTSGSFGGETGVSGTDIGQFTNPSGVGVDSGENVYVVDTGNHRIQKFDTFLSPNFTWGKDVNADNSGTDFEICVGTIPGVENCQAPALGSSVVGEFDSPTSIAFGLVGDPDPSLDPSPEKNIYVADFFNSRIQKFGYSANLGLADGSTPKNIFVAKMDGAFGDFLWTRKAETDTNIFNFILPSLTVDPSDDSVYIGGSYSGTATFDGTIDTVSSAGDDDALVFGYDSSGGFLWAQSAGGSTIDFINDIVFDAINSAWYVAGSSESSDASFGTATGSPFASAGNFDGFLAKLQVPAPSPVPPVFSKSFSPGTIPEGGTSTLTFTIDNSVNPALAVSNIDFTDTLPADVDWVVASLNANSYGPSGEPGINCFVGSDSILGDTLTVDNFSVAGGATCTISIDVTSITAGIYLNTSGIMTSSATSDSGTASDTLTVTKCGNGTMDPGEQCDLGGINGVNNGSCPKTCSSSCAINSCSSSPPSPADGTCGTATNPPAPASAPTSNLCSSGILKQPPGVTGSGPWTWTCASITGGNDSPLCTTATSSAISGACGTANKIYPSSATSYGSDTFCSSGTATNFSSGNFPTATTPTTWDCAGINNGTTISCSASLQAPASVACGTANGQTFQTKPLTNLCASNATASTVNGPTNGLWNWLCYIPLSQPFVQISCSAIAPAVLPPPTPLCVGTQAYCDCQKTPPLPDAATCAPPPPPGDDPPPPPPDPIFYCPDGVTLEPNCPTSDPVDPGDLLPPDPIYPPGGGTPPGNGPTVGPTGPGGLSGVVLGILKSILPAQLVSQITDILGSPAGNTAANILAVLGLVSGVISLFLLDLPFRLLSALFSFLGVKKKERWGTVFNSITLEGIDPAWVVLRDAQGNESQTAITDLEGRFGFAAPAPGIYRITTNKGGYVFPSAKLAGRTSTALYDNLYFGGDIVIKEAGQIIIANIPMDPLNFDWNQFRKNQLGLMTSHATRQKWIARISSFFFGVGFIVSIFALIFAPSPLNVIIFGLYILLFFLRRFSILKAKRRGSITSLGGVPLSFAILRVCQAGTGVEVAHSVADQYGNFYRLIANGRYFVKIDQKISENDYTTVFVSEPFEVTKGLINKKFTITDF